MKIVFLSSYYNHHQASFSHAMYHLIGDGYRFISTKEISLSRRNLGYKDDYDEPFIRSFQEQKAECEQLIEDADVVVFGSAPHELIKDRIRKNKLILRYSERPLKKGNEPLKYFPRLCKWHMQNPMTKRIYMLCASAYTAGDYARFGLFKGKSYRWGYFPETKKYDDLSEMMASKDPTGILWCGRLIDWKHYEDAVQVMKKLKDEGHTFTFTLVGTGDLEAEAKQMVHDLGLTDCVRVLGSMPPEDVRTQMEHAGIFLFTSDRQEGWGAVLNESMNSGCAVVASHAIGSVPFLLKDGENGSIYESRNVGMLYQKVKYLLEHPDAQKKLGMAAYRTITEEWNAEVAAERLIHLAEHILRGEKAPELYESGPCSKAVCLSDKWR